MRELTFRILFSVITFTAAVTLGCSQKGHTFMSQSIKCSMQVWINQSVDKVSGRPWPRYDDGKPLEMTMTDDPCETILHLPSGKTLDLQSKSTTLNQDHGIVTLVSVLPLPSLVDFRTAVAKLEQMAHAIGIQDAHFYETIHVWLQKPPSRNPFGPKYRTGASLEEGVDVFVKVEPHQPEDEPDDGWFVAVDFERALKKRSM